MQDSLLRYMHLTLNSCKSDELFGEWTTSEKMIGLTSLSPTMADRDRSLADGGLNLFPEKRTDRVFGLGAIPRVLIGRTRRCQGNRFGMTLCEVDFFRSTILS
jgi:hypothetical protein